MEAIMPTPQQPNPTGTPLDAFIAERQAPFLALHRKALAIAAGLPETSDVRKAALNVAVMMLDSASSFDWQFNQVGDPSALDDLETEMRKLLGELLWFEKLPQAINAIMSLHEHRRWNASLSVNRTGTDQSGQSSPAPQQQHQPAPAHQGE